MKILVVLSGDGFVRNYLTTGAFSGIEKEHDVCYVASDKVTAGTFSGSYDMPSANQHYALFNVLMWRCRNRSSSFRFRFKRLLQTELLRPNADKLLRFAHGYIHKSSSPLYAMLGRLKYPEISESLVDAVRHQMPHLIIYPSSAYDPEGNDLARIGARRGIKTLFLVDGWDNLSSKSIYWAKPDHLGVWGPQSKEHAIRIHDFEEEQVTCIGTPRFDVYRDNAHSPFHFKYVLFVGQAVAFDEISALQKIDQELDMYSDHKIKVVYRPHPWRQTRFCKDRFVESEFKHVIIDPQMKDAYYKQDHSFQPDLKYYPALVKNAQFVVATPTTMLIESLLCHKRVLLLAYDDKIHLTTPSNSLKHYEHFNEIDKVDGVTMCRSLDSLAYLFRHMGTWESHADLKYYLFDDGRPYAERLAKLVRGLNV